MNRLICILQLGDRLLGTGSDEVREVIRLPEITPVPTAPPGIAGLVSLRGEVITAIDLQRVLGLPRELDLPPRYGAVMEVEGENVCLLVDRVEDVLEVSDTAFGLTSKVRDEVLRPVVCGVYSLDMGEVLMLDTESVMALVTGVFR